MGTSVGSAYVTLMPSMDGFASKVCSEFKGTGSKAGWQFGTGMSAGIGSGVQESSGHLNKLGSVATAVSVAGVAVFAGLTAAVTAIGGAALSAYADYEQLVGGVDTLFGSASATLQQYAEDAYKTCGLSANQYMTQATSFAASLVSSCGGDVAKAAEYANLAMVDMSDNVNKMGSNMQDVQNAYQGFAKQNYTMLDNLKLGYGGTKEEMERLIEDANKLREEQGKNADLTIDSYADVVEAIHTVQENMGITGTTAQEAATTVSGSIGMAKAAWQNFLTGLGRDDVDFTDLTNKLLDSIGAVATNVVPRVAQIGQGIINAFPAVLAGLGSVLAPVLSEALSSAWNIAVNALAGIGIQLPNIDASQIMGAFQTISDAVSTVIGVIRSAFEAISPIVGSVINAVIGIISGFVEQSQPFVQTFTLSMLPAIESFANGAKSLFSALSPAVEGVFTAIQNVVQSFMPVIQNAATQFAPILAQIITVVGELFTAISPFISQIGSVLGPAIETIGSALANLVDAVLPIIAEQMQSVMPIIQALAPVLSTIATVLGTIISAIITVAAQVASVVINIVTTVATFVADVGSTISEIISVISGVWESISSIVGGMVSTIVTVISDCVNGIVSTVGSMVDSVVSFFTSLFDNASNIFNTIVSTLSGAASSIYDAVTGAFNNLVSGVVGACGDLMDKVSSIPSDIMSFFSGIGSWLIDSGASLINGLTQGIQNALGDAINAVKGGLDTIRSFFPFSPAKRGPFSGHGYTTYSGMALMSDWGAGIEAGTGKVESAITGALDKANDLLSTGVAVTTGSITVVTTDKEQRTEELCGDIVSLLEAIRDKDVNAYLDTTLVSSALASRSRSTMRGRGIA